MKLIGITGGIGMGKSTCARHLAELGIPVIDTDVLARQLVEPGHPALSEIESAFGSEIVLSNGQLRRDELARRVFADKSALKRLEAILHPRIFEAWQGEVEKWRSEKQPVGAVIIPLLFETKAERHFDVVICVACSPATQLRRLRERQWDDAQIAQRLSSQWPVEKKITQSDFLIWSDVPLETHYEQLDRVLNRLMGSGRQVTQS